MLIKCGKTCSEEPLTLQGRLMSIKEEFTNLLAFFLREKPLILGIGNPLKSDDSFGLAACDELNNMGINCVKCEYGIESCLTEIKEKSARNILIIDAIISQDDPPGTLLLVNDDSLVNEKYLFTTHTLPLRTVLDILKKEFNVEKVIIIGVTPFSLDYGIELTGDMKKSLKTFIEIFRDAYMRVGTEGREA